MKFKDLCLCVIAFVFGALINSCDEKDGAWESMEWRTQNLAPQNITYNRRGHEIIVNSKGGEINIICQNYSGFWFSNEFPQSNPNVDYKNWRGEWFDLSIKGNTLMCRFKDEESMISDDTVCVGVSAGDIFDRFKIIRRSN